MRKLVVIVVVALAFAGYAFAGDVCVSQNQNQKEKQKQKQIAEGGNARIDFEEKIQGVQPQMPEHLLIPPSSQEVFFWNKYGIPKEKLKGWWSREKTEKIHKSIPWRILFWGPEITKAVVNSGLPKTDELYLKINEFPDPNQYDMMDPINFTGTGKITQYQLLGCANKEAMNQGANLAVLYEGNDGLNTVIQGKTFGLPLSVVEADRNSAITGAIGWGRAEIKKTGEPGIILIPFKLKAKESVPEPASVGEKQKSEDVNTQLLEKMDALLEKMDKLLSM